MDKLLQEYNFTIKFDGENHIPVETLCIVLNEFNTLASVAAQGKEKCNYEVVANRAGSFEVDLVGKAIVPATMFILENQNYIKAMLDTVKTWMEIKNHLKGNAPESVEPKDGKVSIKNRDGCVLVTEYVGCKFFENAAINNSIINIGCSLEASKAEGLNFLGEDGNKIVSFPRKDFQYLADSTANINSSDYYTSTVSNVALFVRKFITRGDAKWEFYFTKSIQATITDKEWLQRFQSGEILVSAGVSLVADLRIETEKDIDGMPIDSTARYYVTKVHNVLFPHDKDQIALQ